MGVRPSRIELGYDPDCGFCWTWVDRFRRRLLRDEQVSLYTLNERELDEHFSWRVRLHAPDGSVREHLRGRAMLELFEVRYPRLRWLWRLPPARWFADALYAVVAANRAFFCRFMTCHPPPDRTRG